MKKVYKYGIIGLVGGLYYALIEVLWRGYSHWTMIFTGGFCILCIYLMNEKLGKIPFFIRCVLGCLVITVSELAVGVVVNIILGWDVWDYSDIRFNFLGQICLNSSLIWLLLCVPAFYGCGLVRNLLEINRRAPDEKISTKD